MATQLNAASIPTPPRHEPVSDVIQAVLDQGPPAVVKQLLGALIDSVQISANREAVPVFRVPNPATLTIEPEQASADRPTVRMGSHYVELRGIEPLASSMRPRRSA